MSCLVRQSYTNTGVLHMLVISATHFKFRGCSLVLWIWTAICAKVTNGWCKSKIVSAELLIVGVKLQSKVQNH